MKIIIIILSAAVLLLAVFAGLLLFTDIFSPASDNAGNTARDPSVTDDPAGNNRGNTDDPTGVPTLEPTREPTPPPAPIGDDPVLQPGSVRVTGRMEYTFVPDRSGIWEFYTSENGDSDPYIEIFGPTGFIASDDDGGIGYNAYLSVYLEARIGYTVAADFFGSDDHSYTLTISYGEGSGDPHGGASISANEARILAQMWLNDHPLRPPDILELERDHEDAYYYGDDFYAFYIDNDEMYWFSILVNKKTGQMLARTISDGEHYWEDIELLDEWYDRYYG